MSKSVWPHRQQLTRLPIHGILQARRLEWVAISFSNAWKWKVKAKSHSPVRLFMTPWTAAYQAPPSMGFSRKEYWSGVPLPSPHLTAQLSSKSTYLFLAKNISVSVPSWSLRAQKAIHRIGKKKKKAILSYIMYASVQFSHSVMSDSLWPHESQHARPHCPSTTPRVHSDSGLSSQWCHPAISSSVFPFSSCPQSLPASESFPMSQLFA